MKTPSQQRFWKDDLRVVHGPRGGGPFKFFPVLSKTRFVAWAGLPCRCAGWRNFALGFVFWTFPLMLMRATESAPHWNITGHIPLNQVIVQAHRGAGVLAEENTVQAFELGWGLGCCPEADLRTTRDGVIVTFHDGNFARVVKDVTPELAQKDIRDLTYDELMQLDVGAWKGGQFEGRRISKLTDAFAAMCGKPERHLYLDIKNVDFKQLAEEVRAYGVERQIVLASPKPAQLRAWKALVPESDTLLWTRGGDEVLGRLLATLRKTQFAGITQLQIHVFPNRTLETAMAIAGTTAGKLGISVEAVKASGDPFTPSSVFIRELGAELRAHHILFQALPYTSDSGVYAQLLDLGLMSFATDHPDVTMRAIRACYEKHHPGPAGE